MTPPTQGEKLIVHILFASVSGSSQWLCRGQGVKTKFTIPFARATNKTMGWRNENNRLFLGCTLHTVFYNICECQTELRQGSGTGHWTDGWKSFQFPFKELAQAPGTLYWVWRICIRSEVILKKSSNLYCQVQVRRVLMLGTKVSEGFFV